MLFYNVRMKTVDRSWGAKCAELSETVVERATAGGSMSVELYMLKHHYICSARFSLLCAVKPFQLADCR